VNLKRIKAFAESELLRTQTDAVDAALQRKDLNLDSPDGAP